jgi:hypothetical protein
MKNEDLQGFMAFWTEKVHSMQKKFNHKERKGWFLMKLDH